MAINFLLLALHVGSALFAACQGRSAERWGAAVVFSAMASTWSAQALLGLQHLPIYIGIDLFAAISFGVIALRNPEKLWPGVAACATFLVFVFSVTRWINYPLPESAYIIAKNLSSIGSVVALGLGTFQARWGKPRPDEWNEFATTLAALPPVRTLS